MFDVNGVNVVVGLDVVVDVVGVVGVGPLSLALPHCPPLFLLHVSYSAPLCCVGCC